MSYLFFQLNSIHIMVERMIQWWSVEFIISKTRYCNGIKFCQLWDPSLSCSRISTCGPKNSYSYFDNYGCPNIGIDSVLFDTHRWEPPVDTNDKTRFNFQIESGFIKKPLGGIRLSSLDLRRFYVGQLLQFVF